MPYFQFVERRSPHVRRQRRWSQLGTPNDLHKWKLDCHGYGNTGDDNSVALCSDLKVVL